MFRVVSRSLAILACAAAFAAASAQAPAQAQNGEPKSGEPAKGGTENAKDPARLDEVADASRTMTGPAARAECVWLGERAVGLMWRDDLDTAFRHLDLYDRFGCPGEHIQISFRCVVRQGKIDPKTAETVDGRVHSCWVNPASPPPPAPVAATEKPGTK
jgi:hypothetical protein